MKSLRFSQATLLVVALALALGLSAPAKNGRDFAGSIASAMPSSRGTRWWSLCECNSRTTAMPT
jgi:hypothetical protein